MKVYIGPYVNWWGPYQIADLLQYVGVSKDTCHKIGHWLSETWVGTLAQKIHDKRSRSVRIRIDAYDTWSMDHTLALIVLPMLSQLKATKHGSPNVDDEDVPPELRASAAPLLKNSWDLDENFHRRWEYVIDRMIWSFEQLVLEDDSIYYYDGGAYNYEKHRDYQMQIQKGLVLFGKYFRSLWD